MNRILSSFLFRFILCCIIHCNFYLVFIFWKIVVFRIIPVNKIISLLVLVFVNVPYNENLLPWEIHQDQFHPYRAITVCSSPWKWRRRMLWALGMERVRLPAFSHMSWLLGSAASHLWVPEAASRVISYQRIVYGPGFLVTAACFGPHFIMRCLQLVLMHLTTVKVSFNLGFYLTICQWPAGDQWVAEGRQ